MNAAENVVEINPQGWQRGLLVDHGGALYGILSARTDQTKTAPNGTVTRTQLIERNWFTYLDRHKTEMRLFEQLPPSAWDSVARIDSSLLICTPWGHGHCGECEVTKTVFDPRTGQTQKSEYTVARP